MSQTAYSQQFGRELDVKQLLKLRGVTASIAQSDFDLSPGERDWVRADLLCPSCRCTGASVVLSDVVKPRGGNTRQAHFRFLNSDGRTAHTLGCDFYPLDDEPGLTRGVDVLFTADDRDTRVVRELVCKAMAIGALSRTDIFNMRAWFLTQRDTNSFVVAGTSAMVDWLFTIRGLPTYEALAFDPIHVGLPGFDAKAAARRHLAFLHKDLLAGVPRAAFDAPVRDRVKRLLSSHRGGRLIAMEPLRPLFDKTVTLGTLMVDYGALKLPKSRFDYFKQNAPSALTALSATLLFVSNWDLAAAFARFARIHGAPLPDDLTAGNVMGLNPFHDFSALEMARFIAALPPESERDYDAQAEFAAVSAMIQRAIAAAGGRP